MQKDEISHTASYTLSHCRSEDDFFKENLRQCNDEVALKLQRCQLFQQKVNSLGYEFEENQPKQIALGTCKIIKEFAFLNLFLNRNSQEISVNSIGGSAQ